MLAALSIRDIVLIERLDLAFEAGLSVLTGETGAGKSILLDAFALALGARGDAGLVRHGATQGQVTAAFDLPLDHPARQVLRENDITDDGDLILRRLQLADGRTRGFVNDQPVSVQVLKQLAAALVEIHGQHDDRALVDPASHRALLDAFGGLSGHARDVAALHGARQQSRRRLEERRAAIAAAAREADFLRHAHDELKKLAPQAGEETQLADQRALMMRAEKIAGDLSDAHEAVAGAASPVPALAAAVRRLERRAGQEPQLVEPAVKAIDQALNALEEARGHLEAALAAAAFNPREMEQIEERLFALRAAGRKYAVPVDALADLAAKFAADLAALDAGEAALAGLEAEAKATEAAYLAAAKALSAARRATATDLDAAVTAELPPLKLERARFTTQIDSDEAGGPEGLDRVEFWVQTNPGTRPGAMVKVASGGELARFMLALKVVLADKGSAPTLIFDEIDTGVGGAVADAIGARLKRLGSRVQVVTVTHAPQVAARASGHFRISKSHAGEESTVTQVERLSDAARREEIARMLAGASVTDEARAAADRLMREAGE